MTLSLYLERVTPLHRVHPVTKVVCMVGTFVATFLLDEPLFIMPVVALVALAAGIARAWVNFGRLRWIFLPVFVFTSVIWSLFYPQGGATGEALRFGLGMALKLVTFLGTGVVFLSTTTIEEAAYGLSCLGMPYRMAFTLTLSFRLVPLFLDSAKAVVEAQRCRGLEFSRGGFLERFRRYVPVIVPVFMGGLRRADHMAIALEVRGFSCGRRRSLVTKPAAGVRDAVAGAVAGAVLVLYLFWWWNGTGSIRPGV